MEDLKIITEKKLLENNKNNWKYKADSLLNGLEYISSKELIVEQLNKLNHVGIKSTKMALNINQEFSNQVVIIVDEELKETLKEIKTLTEGFKLLTETLTKKKSLFQKKEPLEIFFEMFRNKKEEVSLLIEAINIKKIRLEDSIDRLKNMLLEIEDCFFLLERDITLLKYIDENIGRVKKDIVKTEYDKNRYDLLELRTDLLTQQQILFQKHMAFKMLNKSTEACIRNVKVISDVTYNIIHNTMEIQKIIEITNVGNESNKIESFELLKTNFQKVSLELNKVSEKPFS